MILIENLPKSFTLHTQGGAAILGIFHDEAARVRVCGRLVDVTGFTPKVAA